ncbi:hypothetical protein ERJ75_001317400 [Trypanosoma vivax]|nr:hypothetical protein TRVL_04363 [Trypanosoma vivax]KAH8608091.1 hypothetical protein ERJ75_001317400 [Trypanosoma vivax]
MRGFDGNVRVVAINFLAFVALEGRTAAGTAGMEMNDGNAKNVCAMARALQAATKVVIGIPRRSTTLRARIAARALEETKPCEQVHPVIGREEDSEGENATLLRKAVWTQGTQLEKLQSAELKPAAVATKTRRHSCSKAQLNTLMGCMVGQDTGVEYSWLDGDAGSPGRGIVPCGLAQADIKETV